MFSTEEYTDVITKQMPFALLIRTNAHEPRFHEIVFETKELAEKAVEAFKITNAGNFYTIVQTENIEE